MDERGCLGFGAMLEILIEEIEAAGLALPNSE